jgi:phosphatidylglycerophosphate synthase
MQLRWLPTFITISRVVLAVVVCIAAANQQWTLGFWLFIAALLTDFFDGWTAKRFNVATHMGAEMDAYADSTLVAGGFVGLTLAGIVPLWVLLALAFIGGPFGARWFFWPKSKRLSAIRWLSSVALLFVAWTTIVWILAAHAYGWSWWYVAITAVTLAILARLKRHRIRAWARG